MPETTRPNDSDSSRRISKTLPAEATPLALKYLESYLDGQPNRKAAVRALLGCSERTAGRISSRVKPYTAPLKREWAARICLVARKPLVNLLKTRKPREWEQCVMGWNHASNVTEALHFATDCALAIVCRAHTQYMLTGSFGVSYAGGWPKEVVVMLSPAPEMSMLGGKYALHKIVITAERPPGGGHRQMFIRHICPVRGLQDHQFLTAKFLEKTFTTIYEYTKNLAAELQRESARPPAKPW